MSNDNYQAELAALKQAYIENLPERLGVLHDMSAAGPGQWDLNALHRLVHSLSGSALSFGLAAIGACARKLEIELKAVLGADEPASAALANTLADGLRELDALLLKTAAEPHNTAVRETVASVNGPVPVYVLDGQPGSAWRLHEESLLAGYRFTYFSLLSDLQAALRLRPPACLLVAMTAAPGEEIQALRRSALNESGEALPLILLALSGRWVDRLEAVRIGCEGFITLPLQPATLLTLLNELVGSGGEEGARVLIVDDIPELAASYALQLAAAGMAAEYETRSDAVLEKICNFLPDLILMDVYLQDCTGFEVASVIRQYPHLRQIPIIFASSRPDQECRRRAIAQGDFFLDKTADSTVLIRAVIRRTEDAYRHNLALSHDPLTGLLSESAFNRRLENVWAAYRRYRSTFALVLVGVDNLKTLNHRYGHGVGDQILKGLGQLLLKEVRGADTVARHRGGFVLILSAGERSHPLRASQRIRNGLRKLRFSAAGTEVPCGVSIGIAVCSDGDSLSALYQAAQSAQREARQLGGAIKLYGRDAAAALDEHSSLC